MTKATDLPALFARLLKIRDLASPATDQALASVGGKEAHVRGLKMLFYSAPRFTAKGDWDGRISHIQIYEDHKSVFLASFEIGKPGEVRFSKWKRGPWEQLVSDAVPTVDEHEACERAASVAREAMQQPSGLNDAEKRLYKRAIELVMKRQDPSFETRQQ